MRLVSGFSDAWLTVQNFADMNAYNSNYMIAPEVTHEFNLLNDFLHTGLLEEGIAPEDTQQNNLFDRTDQAGMISGFAANSNNNNVMSTGMSGQSGGSERTGSMLPPPRNNEGKSISRPGSAAPGDRDKTGEYYLQAADPSGNDTPEERMSRVLKAKYDAGLLKPFNYINGYARLGKYLDGHIAASSKQKILRTINQFRPKFREKAQGLTDMQLLYVEMWFERQLMDYDRVFASMAVPACCWRRTGEIFRGNKEMAELINVPVDRLRDVSTPIFSGLAAGGTAGSRAVTDEVPGQNCPASNPDRRVDGAILGGVRHSRIRPCARDATDRVLAQEPKRHVESPNRQVLLLLHHTPRRA